jgi:UDP-GlcNAc:undecaprenyl-phosphate GlcNAc-1-phosphate transferase
MSFVIAFGASLALTPVAALLGRSLGLVDRPGNVLKIHTRETPLLGGLAVVAATAIAVVAPRLGWPTPGVAVAVVVAFVAGTVDDARPLPPSIRVVALSAAGLVAAAGAGSEGAVAMFGVALLVLACANAVNILDGQDGLAAGVTAAASLGLAACLWVVDGGEPQLSLAVGGALLGFLAWNRPPARVYLGNGGAYAVGVLLSLGAVTLIERAGWRGLLGAGACLAVPAFEVVFTVARRAVSRDRLSAGDRLHSYDLVAARIGRIRSSAAFVGLALLGAAIAVLLMIVPLWAGIAVASLGAGGAAVWGMRLWSKRSITT